MGGALPEMVVTAFGDMCKMLCKTKRTEKREFAG